MENIKKQVVYQSTNSYETLNQLTPATKNVWFVCHGLGYLSRYFLKHFSELDPVKNYVIAPQAPSKYYLKDDFKHVGASWLTKEDTLMETANVIHYLNAVKTAEGIPAGANLILFGFSQGVSIVMRWLVRSQLSCSKIVLYAGGIPNEITAKDLHFLEHSKTDVQIVYGDQDNYLNQKRLEAEELKIKTLFKGNAKIIRFKGGHEIKNEILQRVTPS